MGEEVLATKKPLVVEKIDYLDREIVQLFELMSSLETRLKPVLLFEPPTPSELKEAKASPNLISQILQEEIDKIITLQEKIKKIQKRLEI